MTIIEKIRRRRNLNYQDYYALGVRGSPGIHSLIACTLLILNVIAIPANTPDAAVPPYHRRRPGHPGSYTRWWPDHQLNLVWRRDLQAQTERYVSCRIAMSPDGTMMAIAGKVSVPITVGAGTPLHTFVRSDRGRISPEELPQCQDHITGNFSPAGDEFVTAPLT